MSKLAVKNEPLSSSINHIGMVNITNARDFFKYIKDIVDMTVQQSRLQKTQQYHDLILMTLEMCFEQINKLSIVHFNNISKKYVMFYDLFQLISEVPGQELTDGNIFTLSLMKNRFDHDFAQFMNEVETHVMGSSDFGRDVFATNFNLKKMRNLEGRDVEYGKINYKSFTFRFYRH